MIVIRVELHSAVTGKITLLGKTIISMKRLRDRQGKRRDYSVRWVGREPWKMVKFCFDPYAGALCWTTRVKLSMCGVL